MEAMSPRGLTIQQALEAYSYLTASSLCTKYVIIKEPFGENTYGVVPKLNHFTRFFKKYCCCCRSCQNNVYSPVQASAPPIVWAISTVMNQPLSSKAQAAIEHLKIKLGTVAAPLYPRPPEPEGQEAVVFTPSVSPPITPPGTVPAQQLSSSHHAVQTRAAVTSFTFPTNANATTVLPPASPLLISQGAAPVPQPSPSQIIPLPIIPLPRASISLLTLPPSAAMPSSPPPASPPLTSQNAIVAPSSHSQIDAPPVTASDIKID